jgi:glutamate racemase
VIATTRTIKSKAYEKAILAYDPKVSVYSYACPLLVSLIEEGCPSEEAARLVIRAYLSPLKKKKIDTLLLGCTHYPLLQHLIQEEVGSSVSIIDPATALAEKVSTFLPTTGQKTTYRFFASDDPERFRKIGEKFLGMKIAPVIHT